MVGHRALLTTIFTTTASCSSKNTLGAKKISTFYSLYFRSVTFNNSLGHSCFYEMGLCLLLDGPIGVANGSVDNTILKHMISCKKQEKELCSSVGEGVIHKEA